MSRFSKTDWTIMAVDDQVATRLLLDAQLRKMGYEHVVLAENGAQAVDLFKTERPDIVLMDVIMPVMDGFEASRQIKALARERWVPIVFITGLDSVEQQIRCLQVGDDFLTRPVHHSILKAKIDTALRTLELHDQHHQKSKELERYYYDSEEEKRFTAHLVRNLVEGEGLRDPAVLSINFPAEHHSGDLIMAARAPNQSLFAVLADCTGHGLAAAINVIPLPQIFYAMVAKGFPLQSIVSELNLKTRNWLPRDRFVAAALIEINERDQIIRVWNGGVPDLLLVHAEGHLMHTWRSRHLPLGVLTEESFDPSCEVVSIDQPGQLFAVSDGLLEASNSSGEPFGQDRFIATVTRNQASHRMQAIIDGLDQHLENRRPHDDVSILMLTVGQLPDPPQKCEAPRGYDQSESLEEGWRFELTLGAAGLKRLDMAPLALSIVDKLKDVSYCKDRLLIVLNELLNNALEYGLLRLESAIKHQPQGIEAYLAMKEERLKALNHGSIQVEISSLGVAAQRLLQITVTDSGDGFDSTALTEKLEKDLLPRHRGLGLVKSLTSQLEFYNHGKTVVAQLPY
jgi:CheY-like chemotaxis protein